MIVVIAVLLFIAAFAALLGGLFAKTANTGTVIAGLIFGSAEITAGILLLNGNFS